MRYLIALVLAAAITTPTLHAEPQLSGTATELKKHLQPDLPTVTLSGEGEVQAQADRAIVRLLVTTENKTLSEALQRNETLRANLTKTLVSKGVPADRIASSRFASTPEHGTWSDKVKSYKIEHQVKVTVDNAQQFSVIAQLVDQAPEIRLQHVEPDHSNKDEQANKALAEAFKQVEKRKAVYEQNLNQKLTPKTARETTHRPSSAPSANDGFLTGGLRFPKATLTGAPSVEFVPTGFFGELYYRVSITVEYSVGGKP